MLTIRVLDSAETTLIQPQLCALVQDSVAGGASVGWVHVPSDAEATAYWDGAFADLASGATLLFVAELDDMLVGTVQLQLSAKENGAHRGEIAKLLVDSKARRKGVGRALMQAVEAEAWRRELAVLVLDTRTNDPSQQLYETLGWQLAGVIPSYARGTDGTLQPTSYMYKLAPSA